jgi:hypothetical protein
MKAVLDQTQDTDGREMHRLIQQHPLPPFCKQASSEAFMGSGAAYAFPPRKLYPCDTAAATWLSTLFFLDKRAEFTPEQGAFIESQLDRFARFHGISERMDQLKATVKTAASANDETNLTNDDFMLLMDGERHYPLRNGKEVKVAAEFLRKNARIIPLSYRQKMASRVLVKADQYGAALGGDLDNFMEQQAGRGHCSAQAAAGFLFDRARLLKVAGRLDAAIEMGKMAKAALLSKEAIHDADHRRELAAIVDRMDREQGLHEKFADLQLPEDVLFELTEKKASDLRNAHVATSTGNYYKKDDLTQLKLADIADFMGDEFAEAVSDGALFVSGEKLAAIVPTLPLADVKLFDRMVSSLGVQPVAKQAAHQREGFSTAELVALAEVAK